MAEKTFVNTTGATLQITLFIRQGESPVNQDGTSSFTLNPGETETITYGDAQNIFLNGLVMFTILDGDLYSKIQFVTIRESELDDLLNTNDVITFTKVLTDYVISGSNPFLDAVNNAQTVSEIRTAIENPQLGLDLSAYNSLSESQKDQVANTLLTGRPVGGYPTVDSVQVALNTAINELVDPNNVYVRAGEVGGNGSIAHPFGTITQGIAAVNAGGTVHILSGTYPITTQIVVNKVGITLLGEAGTQLLLQANIIPLLITAANITIDGLTITSDIPYAREFIQIGANNVTLRDNTIFGPPQALPMSTWVVNRAVVSQGGMTGMLLENNTFFSLRTGMYINPNGMGAINNNTVYNTKGGFLVDGAFTTFNGNSWGIPANEFDIVLLAGTTTGPPYDNLAALSAANNGATISDQR
jgi:hypothetical protein